MIDVLFWAIILVIGFVGYFLGVFYKVSPLFFLGCALIIGSGMLLWGSDGLLLQRQVSEVTDSGNIIYTDVGILSVMIFDFSGLKVKRGSPFHY
jgi:hypothetical protein